jgi:hypothetical protein
MIVKGRLFGGEPVGGKRGKGEGDRGEYIEVYYIFMYENSTMSLTKMCQRIRRESGEERVIQMV